MTVGRRAFPGAATGSMVLCLNRDHRMSVGHAAEGSYIAAAFYGDKGTIINEIGHGRARLGHLGNIAHRTERTLTFDPARG